MKLKFLSVPLAAVSGITMAFAGSYSPARAEATGFSCKKSEGLPATIASTRKGNVPVIRWASDALKNAGFDPQKRCEIVSNKFEKFRKSGQLNYLTTGRENNQNVICVAQVENGPCVGTLFTLKPNENPSQALFNLYKASAGAGVLNEKNSSPSVSGSLYIDMNEWLDNAPTVPLEKASSNSEHLLGKKLFKAVNR